MFAIACTSTIYLVLQKRAHIASVEKENETEKERERVRKMLQTIQFSANRKNVSDDEMKVAGKMKKIKNTMLSTASSVFVDANLATW